MSHAPTGPEEDDFGDVMDEDLLAALENAPSELPPH
jgi:hypothetical protein